MYWFLFGYLFGPIIFPPISGLGIGVTFGAGIHPLVGWILGITQTVLGYVNYPLSWVSFGVMVGIAMLLANFS